MLKNQLQWNHPIPSTRMYSINSRRGQAIIGQMYITGVMAREELIYAVHAHVSAVLIHAANVSVVIALHAADKKTATIALSGLLLALTIALLYVKTLIPVLDFSIYILISFFTGIVLQESNHRWAWIFFAASVILSLILPINKLAFLVFYSFFGYYGIVKYYIEKLKSKIIGFLFKLLFINLAVILNYFIASSFMPGILGEGIQLYLIVLIASVFIFIYDYVYTLAMVFYNGRIRKLLRR